MVEPDPDGLSVEVDGHDVNRVDARRDDHHVVRRATTALGPAPGTGFDQPGHQRADRVVGGIGLDHRAGDLEPGDEGPPGPDLVLTGLAEMAPDK